MTQRGEPSSAYRQGLEVGTGSGGAPQFRIDEPEFEITFPNIFAPLQGDWTGVVVGKFLIYWFLTPAIAARLQTETFEIRLRGLTKASKMTFKKSPKLLEI
jgi:hypothetical protein